MGMSLKDPDEQGDSVSRVRWIVLGMLARLAADHPTFCGGAGQNFASDIGEEIYSESWGDSGPLQADELEAIRAVSRALIEAQTGPNREEEVARLRQTTIGNEIAWLASNAFFAMMKNGMPPYPP